LIEAKNIKKGNTCDETDFLPTLKWLDGKRSQKIKTNPMAHHDDNDQADTRFSRTSRNFYRQILVPA